MRNPFRRTTSSVTAVPIPVEASADERAAHLARVRGLVRPGFLTRDQVVAALIDGQDEELARSAEHLVDLVWAARAADLEGTDGGDYDRLRAAFAELERAGVLARMNFTCCQTCGTAEIADERTPATDVRRGGYPYEQWAFTFFHEQDAERLGDVDAMLRLSFSSFVAAPDADPADVAAGRDGDADAMRRVMEHTDATVGRLIVAALVDAGLTVTWDGTAGQRIGVAVPQWRKPLPA
ncbi:MAG: hypothetical protein OSB43_05310 [Nocardioides sp.]|uniref:DUF6891 domain-containing protein n=1 Tax=Nocardioides sp. TaxID=35761 RepID=UPI00239A3CC4|nr:hypothetical protein [Nocardioides sp.]MDE0775673.1 hypothetical protein [Nocardioides sp.]